MIRKVYLEITNQCNLSCSFCHGTGRSSGFLSESNYRRILSSLQASLPGTRLFFHLMGEPLLHPQLSLFISLAREQGFHPALTTNGTLLPDVPCLANGRLERIHISLHSAEANSAFSSPDYFENCIAFARIAAGNGSYVVLRLWNLESSHILRNEEYLAKLQKAFPAPWEKTRSGYRMADHIFLEYAREFQWPDLKVAPIPQPDACFCYALRDQVGILVDGTVVPCCLDAEGALALGNIFETPLSEILASSRARNLYDGFTHHMAREELCRRCGYASQAGYRQS